MIGGRQKKLTGKSSSVIIRIAIGGIAIGMAVMILAVAMVTGFQNEIRNKVIGFGSHAQIALYNPANTLTAKPVDRNQAFLPALLEDSRVANVNVYAYKTGIISANEELQGVVAKGIDRDFDWSFFEQNLVDGRIFKLHEGATSDSIVISKFVLNRLELKLGDKITVSFIENEKERKRRFIIGGVYESGMDQFDASILLCDIRHVQRLNSWDSNQVAGFELTLKRYEDLEDLDEILDEHLSWEFSSLKITDQYMEIFGWLKLQDMNVVIILSLMILVSGINMISALLVLILERTNMVGILKALGATNASIARVFLINGAYLLSLGLFWGNIVGLGIGWLQQHFEFIKLDKSQYYIDHAPISLDFTWIMGVNAGAGVLCMLMLLLPSRVISKIDPVRTIRFN